jgi:hypothetical protein
VIQLHCDYLVVKHADGHGIPCSAENVTIELIGESAGLLDPELIRDAAVAVLHYFRHELDRTSVSVGEFTEALERVLRGFGLSIQSSQLKTGARRVRDSDLRKLACESGKGFELVFFPRLRDELRQQLRADPQVLCFRGLRGCVKQLIGAQRWTDRCQRLNDQIVEFLRGCLQTEQGTPRCSLVVM